METEHFSMMLNITIKIEYYYDSVIEVYGKWMLVGPQKI